MKLPEQPIYVYCSALQVRLEVPNDSNLGGRARRVRKLQSWISLQVVCKLCFKLFPVVTHGRSRLQGSVVDRQKS